MRLAVALALLALLGTTARPVVACTMGMAPASTAPASTLADAHAHHAPVSQDVPGGTAPDAGRTECPDLAGCVAAALPAAPVTSAVEPDVPPAPERPLATRVASTLPAPEPPPPRA